MELYEISGKLDIDTGFLPIDIYEQYVTYAYAKEGENTAWLAGFGAKHGPFKMDYNYRDTKTCRCQLHLMTLISLRVIKLS